MQCAFNYWKCFKDAGLQTILIEAGAIAEGSVEAVLDGRQYNRTMRVHKCMFEALHRLALRNVIPRVQEYHIDIDDIEKVEQGFEQMQDLNADLTQKSFEDSLKKPELQLVLSYYISYLEFLRSSNGPLSSFWMSYLDFVNDTTLGLVRATREGNWELHMAAIRAMIPWCFAYDKINYARYLSAYYADMSQLYVQHPDVYKEFSNGAFAVQIGDNNPFVKVSIDQTIEEIVNKDTQPPGKTCRFSLKPNAAAQYYMTAECGNPFAQLLREMLCLNISSENTKI